MWKEVNILSIKYLLPSRKSWCHGSIICNYGALHLKICKTFIKVTVPHTYTWTVFLLTKTFNVCRNEPIKHQKLNLALISVATFGKFVRKTHPGIWNFTIWILMSFSWTQIWTEYSVHLCITEVKKNDHNYILCANYKAENILHILAY